MVRLRPGIGLLAAGLPFGVIGVWMLSERLDTRRRATQVAEELRRELYEQRRWGPQSAVPLLRQPMTTLATF